MSNRLTARAGQPSRWSAAASGRLRVPGGGEQPGGGDGEVGVDHDRRLGQQRPRARGRCAASTTTAARPPHGSRRRNTPPDSTTRSDVARHVGSCAAQVPPHGDDRGQRGDPAVLRRAARVAAGRSRPRWSCARRSAPSRSASTGSTTPSACAPTSTPAAAARTPRSPSTVRTPVAVGRGVHVGGGAADVDDEHPPAAHPGAAPRRRAPRPPASPPAPAAGTAARPTGPARRRAWSPVERGERGPGGLRHELPAARQHVLAGHDGASGGAQHGERVVAGRLVAGEHDREAHAGARQPGRVVQQRRRGRRRRSRRAAAARVGPGGAQHPQVGVLRAGPRARARRARPPSRRPGARPPWPSALRARRRRAAARRPPTSRPAAPARPRRTRRRTTARTAASMPVRTSAAVVGCSANPASAPSGRTSTAFVHVEPTSRHTAA